MNRKPLIIIACLLLLTAALFSTTQADGQVNTQIPAPTPTVSPEYPFHNDETLSRQEISHSEPLNLNQFQLAAVQANVAAEERHELGEWGPLLDWPIHATHAAMLPDGDLMSWHANYIQPVTGNGGIYLSDPTTLQHTDISFNNSGIDTGFFCPGFNTLPDGRLMGVGGSFNRDSKDTLFFDGSDNSWSQQADTEYVRYYGNITPLGSGEMMIFAGVYAEGQGNSQADDYPEIYSVENDSWRTLTNAQHDFDHNWYHWTQQAPNGTVFYAGPQTTTRSLDTNGQGIWTDLSTRDSFFRTYGSYAVYNAAEGKMLIAGGRGSSAALDNADILDMNTGQRVATNSMAHQRRNADLTILADGTLFVSGGITINKLTDYSYGVLPGEIWDPETETWTETDGMVHPRQYHSSAVLLPDGRVFKGGGGPCAGLGGCIQSGFNSATDELFDAEFFSPPYLFNADGSLAARPTITSAPESIEHGFSFVVESPEAGNIAKMHLIRLGATTHAQDMGQRLVPLSFSTSGSLLTVSGTSTSNPNVAVPGYYMLFIVDDSGVPSLAHMLNVAGLNALSLLPPGSQNNSVNQAVSLQMQVVNPDNAGLTFSASGLPSGLSIDQSSGLISGTPDTIGSGSVTVSVSGGGDSDSVSFGWEILAPANQPPTITDPSPLQHTVGESVRVQIEADDPDIPFGDSLSYSTTTLPAGLSLNTTTGEISGIPTAAGTVFSNVTVTDSQNESTTINFDWVIDGAALEIDPLVTSPALVNSNISYTASASGGFGFEYRWRFGDGSAETGYSSNPTISHSYAAPGRYTLTLTVRNASGSEQSIDAVQMIFGSPTANPSVWSTPLLYKESTDQVWSVNPDNDSITIIDAITLSKIDELPSDGQPSSLALAPDGSVWVTNKDAATISVFGADFTLAQTISLPDASQPHGIVFAPGSNTAYVVLEALGEVAQLDSATGSLSARRSIGAHPRHLSIHGGSGKLFVSRYISPPVPGEGTAIVDTASAVGEIVVIDPATFTIEKTITLAHSDLPDSALAGGGLPNYLGPLVITQDGEIGHVPSKQDNIRRGALRDGQALDHDNTVRSISSHIDFASEAESLVKRIDHDDAAVPVAATYDRYGIFLFVVMEGSREVRALDARSGIELTTFDVGMAPQGIAISPDGKTLFVHNFLSRTVSAHDISGFLQDVGSSITELGSVDLVANEALSPEVLQGKQIFYDGADFRLSPAPYLSCAACHNDGSHDGRTWDFTGLGEGLRNTIPLNGRGGTAHGPVHWSANFDEIHDFENQIRSMQEGEGLMSDADFNATQDPLGPSKAGKSADLDALAAYVTSLDRFAPSPYAASSSSFSAAGETGREIFFNAGCQSCHSGQAMTDSPQALLHDIGTIKPSSGGRSGETLTGLDTPTLRDLWLSAPYLHDGSAATIAEAIEAHSGSSFSTAELDQLTTFLLEVGDLAVVRQGDVSCDAQSNTSDALFILQYDIGLRTDSATCPLPAATADIYTPACDVNDDAACDTTDALFVLQCNVGISNPFCE